MKSSLWTFANIASTVCVSDDAVRCYVLIVLAPKADFRYSLVRRFDFLLKTAMSRKISVRSSTKRARDRRFRTRLNT